jgi:hypothetical protein
MFTDEHGEIHEITDREAVIQQVINGVELEAQSLWYACDIMAYLWIQTANRAERRALLKELSANSGVNPQTIRRRIRMGMTFPPELRRFDRPANLYLAALTTGEPEAAIMEALARGWSVADLREHIVTGKTPPERVNLLDDTYDAADLNPGQIAELAAALAADAPVRGSGRLLTVRIRIDAEYQPEAA